MANKDDKKEKQEPVMVVSDLTPVFRGMLALCTQTMFENLFPETGSEEESEETE